MDLSHKIMAIKIFSFIYQSTCFYFYQDIWFFQQWNIYLIPFKILSTEQSQGLTLTFNIVISPCTPLAASMVKWFLKKAMRWAISDSWYRQRTRSSQLYMSSSFTWSRAYRTRHGRSLFIIRRVARKAAAESPPGYYYLVATRVRDQHYCYTRASFVLLLPNLD